MLTSHALSPDDLSRSQKKGAASYIPKDEMSNIAAFLDDITPAIKYLNIVIPAKAGIQEGTGCRIKSGMTELDYLIARLIY